MIHKVAVAILLFLFYTEYADAVCGNTPFVWRNNNSTCPERAICADVFEQVRDWYNGTRCEETRTLSNCLCPGGTVCPTSNPNHLLYSTRRHKQFVCRPTCTLPWCGNVRASRMPGRSGGRGNGRNNDARPTAQTTIQDAVEFGRRTYQRMDCRCPRHHNPSSARGRHGSVQAIRYQYNYASRSYSILYVCSGTSQELQTADTCDD